MYVIVSAGVVIIFVMVGIIILLIIRGFFDSSKLPHLNFVEQSISRPLKQIITAQPSSTSGDIFGDSMIRCNGSQSILLVSAPGFQNGRGAIYRIKCDHFQHITSPLVVTQESNIYNLDVILCGNETMTIYHIPSLHAIKIFDHSERIEHCVYHPLLGKVGNFGTCMTLEKNNLYTQCEHHRWGSIVASFKLPDLSFETLFIPSNVDLLFGDVIAFDSIRQNVIITGTKVCYIWQRNVQVAKLPIYSQPLDVQCCSDCYLILLQEKVVIINAETLQIGTIIDICVTSMSCLDDQVAFAADANITLFKYCCKSQTLINIDELLVEEGFKDMVMMEQKIIFSYPNNFTAGGNLICYNIYTT
jgi:hypothetical protein